MLSFAYVLSNIAAAIAAAAAQVGAAAPEQPPSAEELSSSRVQEALSKCGERRFLSVAEALVDGDKRRATILLCAKTGDSDAQWAATLEKSAAQIAASPQVTDESKLRLRGEFAAAVAKARAGPVPGVAAVTGGTGATGLSGVAAIPSVKMPDRRPRTAPLPAADALVANVPPLPAPLPPRAAQASLLANMLPQPRISIRCLESGEAGPGMECDEVRLNTILLVRADENFPSPATLRFMRNGDARADQSLGSMRKGQVARLRLPSDVCRGVVRSEIELETVVTDPRTKSEQSRRSLGPVMLRC
jgi:hypothetical protein